MTLEHRHQQNSGLDPEILCTLQHMLLENNQYAIMYRHAYEILQRYDSINDISIRLRVTATHNHQRYNLPTINEVAVILPGIDGVSTDANERDIILENRAGGLQIINDLHPAYVPLYYVLLFPYGENGWHPALRLQSSNNNNTLPRRLTQTRYVAY